MNEYINECFKSLVVATCQSRATGCQHLWFNGGFVLWFGLMSKIQYLPGSVKQRNCIKKALFMNWTLDAERWILTPEVQECSGYKSQPRWPWWMITRSSSTQAPPYVVRILPNLPDVLDTHMVLQSGKESLVLVTKTVKSKEEVHGSYECVHLSIMHWSVH